MSRYAAIAASLALLLPLGGRAATDVDPAPADGEDAAAIDAASGEEARAAGKARVDVEGGDAAQVAASAADGDATVDPAAADAAGGTTTKPAAVDARGAAGAKATAADATTTPVAEPAATVATDPSPEATGTLWLVQPLYPGQDAVVGRTEAALTRLFPESAAGREVIGRGNLALQRPDAGPVEACLFGDAPCDDPVGALVSAYGFHDVILIKAGQEGGGYRFRVAAFKPGTFSSATAENADATLEAALLGAVVKVAPLASQFEIATEPAGATVFIDGERVGVTPLLTQALPGERTFRLEAAKHQPIEWKQEVPVRGSIRVEKKLEETPATLLVVSAGARILVDGKPSGENEATIGVGAGKHAVRLERDGYEPWETTVEVAAGEELRIERALEPTGWHTFSSALSRSQEAIYRKGGHFLVAYDSFQFVDDRLAADSIDIDSRKSDRVSPGTPLWGITAEFASNWRHFGLVYISGSYFQSAETFGLHVPEAGDGPVNLDARVMGGTLRLFHPQLRLAVWKVLLNVQGGFIGRLAHVDKVSGEGFSKGFLLADVGAEVVGGAKIFLVDGLFLEGAYVHSFTIAGSTEGTTGFRGGIGYAF